MTPSDKALADLQTLIAGKVPGFTFKVRRNGADWANAPSGDARRNTLAMSNDTIVFIASMTKPITATAFVAMIDDWQAFKTALDNIAGAPLVPIALHIKEQLEGPLGKFTRNVTVTINKMVPAALLPVFSSLSLASDLMHAGLGARLPASLASIVSDFITEGESAPSPPHVPPGWGGLMRLICRGVPVPQYGDPFLPLIRSRVEARATALGFSPNDDLKLDAYNNVTIEQLIDHQSSIPDGLDSLLYRLVPGGQNAIITAPEGGTATFDLWGYLALYFSQVANAQGGYKNDDYTLLGAIIDECTGGFDDYVNARLFSDPRFSDIRRYVTDPARSAIYYTYAGVPPSWQQDTFSVDYRGWGAFVGFFATANQMTDWLYALYTGAAVNIGGGRTGPIISTANLQNRLFGAKAYFCAGSFNAPNVANWTNYVHNGGWSWNSGSSNGKMGVLVGPHSVLTVFFEANGALDAEAPFNGTLPDLMAMA